MKTRLYFAVTTAATAAILLWAWKKDPAFVSVPSPGKTLILAIGTFLMVSVLIFAANMFSAIARSKQVKTEEELEAIMVPAMRAEEYDARIRKWTDIPHVVVSALGLGALCAFGLHYLIR